MKIVYFGTSPFAAQVLEYLIDHRFHIVAVVTRPDKPKGRSLKLHPSAVKALVADKWPTLPLFQPEKASTDSFGSVLKEFNPDFFVVVAYGEIIKKNLLDIPSKMAVNVHASLLPKYRGAAPIQRAIMNGEKETGVTIMEMVLEMDAGDILNVGKVAITNEMTFGDLEKKLCALACPLLAETIENIEKGIGKKIAQDHQLATIAKKILGDDRVIDWQKSSEAIRNQVMGLSPSPGAFCSIVLGGEQKRLGVKRVRAISNREGGIATNLSSSEEEWIVGCGDGALALLEVQLEGKRAMSTKEFLNGLSEKPKMVFDCIKK